jgi:arabinogalactan oligomer/maltooligosaccharide transport system permease protein
MEGMATSARASTSRGRSRLGESLYAYGFIGPAIVAMVIASFIPIAFTIFVAFTNWDGYHNALVQGFHFVGFANFQEIANTFQASVLGVVIWTLVFATASTVINFAVGLFLAFLLNNPNMPERNLYRTILILPWALPGSITILAWTGLLNTDYGPINLMLSSIHLGPFNPGHVPWLDDPNWARFSVVMVNLWFGFPFMMTACLGALQAIPTDLGEAAQVDGAGVLTRFRRITLPLLRAATLPLVISTFAYNLNNFGAVYLLTAGGPTASGSSSGATDILPTYTYNLAIVLNRYGLACAYAIVIFLFIGSLSAAQMKYSRAFEDLER